MVKKIFLTLVILLVIIQVVRPDKNDSSDTTNHIGKTYTVPDDVKAILTKACYDCHSNNTRYPWYAELQPVAWWLDDHVKEGKSEMNFDDFSSYRIAKQYRKLEECIEEVKEGEMPLTSYTWLHKDAKLTEAEKLSLLNWCTSIRDSIRSKYPADSLVSPRKK